MAPKTERLAVAGLVVLAIALRVGLVLAVHNAHPERAIVDDTTGYVDPARSLLEDGDYDISPTRSGPEFQRTPGYPAFVAAVYWVSGDSDMAVVLVQAVLSGLSVLLALLLVRRLFASALVALAAGAMVALDPLQITQSGLIVTETLATVFTLLAAYCGVRFVQANFSVPWGVSFALALVAATYVRPTTYYFPLVVAALLAVLAVRKKVDRGTIARAGVAFLLPCVVLLGAWNVRNHREVDSWRFTGIEATNLYWYRAAAIVAAQDGTDLEDTQVRLTEELSRGVVPEFEYEDYRSGKPPPVWEDRQAEYYDRAQREAVDILRSDPRRAVQEYVRGIYGQVVQSGWVSASEYVAGKSPPGAVSAVGLLVVWGIEALAVVGVVVALRRPAPERYAHLLTIGLAAYTIVVSAAGPDGAGGSRFRIPIWPIWCVYAAIGLSEIWRLRQARSTRSSRSSDQ